jgi:hypothetical protein
MLGFAVWAGLLALVVVLVLRERARRRAAPARLRAELVQRRADELARRRNRPTALYHIDGNTVDRLGGRVVRLGITHDVDQRMRRYERDARNPRTKTSRWWPLVTGQVPARVVWYPTWDKARAAEIAELGARCPVGNDRDVPRERRSRIHA